MTRFTTKQLYQIAAWCSQRKMLPDRITGDAVKAACRSLGIENDGDYDLYQVKSIGKLMDDDDL